MSVLQRSFILTSHVVSSPTMHVSIRTSGTTGRGRNGGRRTAGCLPFSVNGPLCGIRLPARGWSLGPGLTETPDPTCRVGGDGECLILKCVGRPSMYTDPCPGSVTTDGDAPAAPILGRTSSTSTGTTMGRPYGDREAAGVL